MNRPAGRERQLPALRIRRIDIAIALFGLFGTLMARGLTTYHDRAWTMIIVAFVPAALWLRFRPAAAALVLLAGAVILRLGYIDIGFSDQILVSQAAANRAFAGLSPYGVGYPESIPPGQPFPYGPLALVWWLPGPIVELVASVLLMVLLIRERSWLTFGLFASVPAAVYLNTAGINDYSPGLLIAAGLVMLRTHALVGAGLLAMAGALKAYAFAWLPALIGFAGWRVGAAMLGFSVVLWAPIIAWGVGGYIRSVALAGSIHPASENALNLPALRFVAVPVACLGLFVRRWEGAVLVGSAAFTFFLFLDRWASLGYWLAVGPVTGMALERWAFGSQGAAS